MIEFPNVIRLHIIEIHNYTMKILGNSGKDWTILQFHIGQLEMCHDQYKQNNSGGLAHVARCSFKTRIQFGRQKSRKSADWFFHIDFKTEEWFAGRQDFDRQFEQQNDQRQLEVESFKQTLSNTESHYVTTGREWVWHLSIHISRQIGQFRKFKF